MSDQKALEDQPLEQRTSLWSLPLEGLRTLLQGLWACRVSLLSLVAGIYVLWNVAQAHDLFVELNTGTTGHSHWALFFASVLVFWILPVHLSARLMLEAHSAAHPTEFVSRGSRIVNAFPWILSLLCLGAIALALVAAKNNIPIPEPGGPEQVKRLLDAASAQVDTLLWVTGGLAVLFLLVWALVYPLLLRRSRTSGLLDTWLVRKVAEWLFDPDRRQRGGALTATEQQELGWTITRRRQIAVAALLLFVLWLLSCAFVVWRPVDVPIILRRAPMLPIVFGAWIPVLTLPAYLATRWRLPIMAGFIIGLTLLGAYGRDIHAVRLLADKPARASMLGAVCFPDYRGTRMRPAGAAPVEARQIGLEAAIDLWRQVNGCPYGQPCKKRPIIVAAEGGASRAAFFAASVPSYLQDTSPVAASGRSEFAQQLFAISSVSGGTLGAAAFVATLDQTNHTKAGPSESRPPSIDTTESADDTLWFRNRSVASDPQAQGARFQSYVQPALKDPLQVMLAGDFLSPVSAGLGLDVWWGLHCEDRATVIERAWENRFEAVLPPPITTKGAGASADYGLARPLSSFLPTAERWRPLLIFNGSSVSTGRRIITSTLNPLTRKQRPPQERGDPSEYEPVFGDAYDFYDHLCRSSTATTQPACTCTGLRTPDRRIKGCDVRLSTAVTNSARFPIVTPQGDIRDPNGEIHDRIVDGGYFDNFGVLSATEVATQLRAIDEAQAKARGSINPAADALQPFILLISNDPEYNPAACPGPKGTTAAAQRSAFNQTRFTRADADYQTRIAPEPPKDQSPVLFADVRYPISAALRSWTASSRLAPNRLSLLQASQYGFGIVQVCPQYLAKDQVRQVSMNWWLSMPIQAFLDSQVCAPHNDLEMRAMAAVLQGKSESDPDWASWTAQWQQSRVIACDLTARPNRGVEYGPSARLKK